MKAKEKAKCTLQHVKSKTRVPKIQSASHNLDLNPKQVIFKSLESNTGMPNRLTGEHNLDVNPKEVIFKSFEVNEAYKESIQVTNTGRKTTRFEVLQLPIGSEFSFKLKSTKSSLAPGITVTIQIYFNPTKLNDKSETLNIKLDDGQTLRVALKALRDPPTLTFTGKELEFFCQDTIDVGCYFVASHNKMDVCVVHHGGAAKYFILSAELATEYNATKATYLLLDSFTIEPIYFTMKNNTQLILSLNFRPQYCGPCSEEVVFLCDNGATRKITLKGSGVEFVRSSIVFEDVESKSNFPVNNEAQDDPSCEWFCDMGTVCDSVAMHTFTVRNNCPARNKFAFEWRVEPVGGTKRVAIPVDNISVVPSYGEFTHHASVTFKVRCKVPGEIYAEAGFITRLYCYVPKGSMCYREFGESLKTISTSDRDDCRENCEMSEKSNTFDIISNNFSFITAQETSEIDDHKENINILEENDVFDIKSNDPSFIIPSDMDTACVCVGSIEFLLDCRQDVRISFNPCFIHFQAPITVNHMKRQCVFVKNECSQNLTCQCLRKTNCTGIRWNIVPKCFELCPFQEKYIEVIIKPVSLEPLELDIVFLIEENHHYRPKLKITGTVSAGEIEVVEDIVNCGTVKLGDSILVPIEFKNNFHTKTKWNMYKIKESLCKTNSCLEHFLSSKIKVDCASDIVQSTSLSGINSAQDYDTENVQKFENQLPCSSLLAHQKNIQGLINDFRILFPEMCKFNSQEKDITRKHQIEKWKKRNAHTDENQRSNENLNLTNSFRSPTYCDASQIVSETIDLNIRSANDNESMEPILTGYLSSSDVTHHPGMLSFESETTGLGYKLFEFKVQDCVRHKLVIADFCMPLVALQPTVIAIGHTSPSVKSRLSVTLVNLTKCSWKYSWGQPENIDEKTVNLTIDKECGLLKSEQTEEVVMKIQPSTYMLEEIRVPCYIEGLKEPLQLVIQCKVENVSVTVSWYNYDRTRMTFNWPNEDLLTEKSIWCGLEMFHISPKSLRTASSITSYEKASSVLENFTISKSNSVVSTLDFNFNRYSEKDDKISVSTEENISKAEDESFPGQSTVTMKWFDTLLYGQYEGIYCNSLHFENVKYKTPTKQTITVANPAKHPCSFTIRVQYFTPRLERNQAEQYIIPTKRYHDTNWEDLIDVNKGLVITVSNAEYKIAHQELDVEVWVYTNTWGLYMDTITLEFASLPSFHIPISVSVQSPPARFRPTKCFQNMYTPVYEMSPISFGLTDHAFTIPLENTSGVPLKVFWITSNQGKEHDEEEWSNIAMNMIFFKDGQRRPSIPEKSKTQAFYIKEKDRIMRLKANDSTQMLPIQFNTDLLSHDMDALLFHSSVTGYIGVDADAQVNNIGVYREVKQISCQVLATAGATRLQFTPCEPKELLFLFQTGRIFSSSNKIKEEKTYELQNLDSFSTICEICTEEPFSIVHVVIAEKSVDFNKPIQVLPKQTMYITVCCAMTPDTVNMLENENPKTSNHNSIFSEKLLQVFYNMKFSVATLQLGVQIAPPIIRLSADHIDFHTIYVGDTAFKFFSIEIINGDKKDVRILPHPGQQSPFDFQVEHSGSKTTLRICIKFTPKERKHFEEEWKITAHNTYRKLHISGSGDEDQKHRV